MAEYALLPLGILALIIWLLYRIAKAIVNFIKRSHAEYVKDKKLKLEKKFLEIQAHNQELARKRELDQAERELELRRIKHEENMAMLAKIESDRKNAEEQRKRNWLSGIKNTKVLNQTKSYLGNGKFTYQTTFMMYYFDGTHEAKTFENGTEMYDCLMSKTE